MNWELRLQPEAEREFEEAAVWYEMQRTGLGQAFVDAVDRAFDRVLRFPRAGVPVMGTPKELELRRVPVPTFPYHVVYQLVGATVHVLAVAHDHRHPGYWRGRSVHPG